MASVVHAVADDRRGGSLQPLSVALGAGVGLLVAGLATLVVARVDAPAPASPQGLPRGQLGLDPGHDPVVAGRPLRDDVPGLADLDVPVAVGRPDQQRDVAGPLRQPVVAPQDPGQR